MAETTREIAYVYQMIWPNGKMYLGVAWDPIGRMKAHCRAPSLRGDATRKHGLPKMKVLLCGTRSYCMEVEQKLTDVWSTVVPNGYNLQRGGVGGSRPSEQTRQRQSESHKGYVMPQGQRDKIAAGNRGKVISPEQKAILSIKTSRRLKGIKWSQAQKISFREQLKPWSEERKAEHSQRMQRWWDERRTGCAVRED